MYLLSKIRVALTKPIIVSVMHKPVPVCHIGPGKVRKIAEIVRMRNIKRVLVITDEILLKLGLLNSMMEDFKTAGIEVAIFSGVKPDPTFPLVEECLALCKQHCCQAVIAFGGGSVLDTAKVVAVSFTNNKTPREMVGLLKAKKNGLFLVAVPTTAGTGSEATIAAVISDPETHQKLVVVDPKIVPTEAVLDPELTVGLPPHITAQTGLDALIHALESYLSDYSTTRTRALAEAAIKSIYEHLEYVYNNPSDLQGREALLLASFYAGMAFTSTYVGYVHAFAHTLGRKYGIPHGLSCAIMLPHIMKQYETTCAPQFAKLADLTGVSRLDASMEMKSKQFVESLYDLNKRMGIPAKADQLAQRDIEEICRLAFSESHGTYPVPAYFSSEQAKKLLLSVAGTT